MILLLLVGLGCGQVGRNDRVLVLAAAETYVGTGGEVLGCVKSESAWSRWICDVRLPPSPTPIRLFCTVEGCITP